VRVHLLVCVRVCIHACVIGGGSMHVFVRAHMPVRMREHVCIRMYAYININVKETK